MDISLGNGSYFEFFNLAPMGFFAHMKIERGGYPITRKRSKEININKAIINRIMIINGPKAGLETFFSGQTPRKKKLLKAPNCNRYLKTDTEKNSSSK